MATTKSNLQLLLRAAVSHGKTTTLHRPYHNLLRHSHSSPTSFLHSHPSNLPISNPHLFTTPISRSVHSLAPALHKKRKNPRSIWPYALTGGCIVGLTGIVLYKLREKPVVVVRVDVSIEMELRLQGLVPDMYRKGHSVVVELLYRPIKDDSNAAVNIFTVTEWPRKWELYLSATEVLDDQPHQLAAALQRNNKILAHKLLASQDKWQIVSEQEQKDSVIWHTTQQGDVISGLVVDLSKSKSVGRVSRLALSPLYPNFVLELTCLLKKTLNMFKDSPNLLQEGHSVFIKGLVEYRLDEVKKDDSYKIEEAESDEIQADKWAKSITGRTKRIEYRFSAEAVAKHDERYMPREATAAVGWRNVAE